MKILFNNRKDRLNWGARSTGKALYQILSKQHEIVGEFDLPVYYTLSSFQILKTKILKRYNNLFSRMMLKIIGSLVKKTSYNAPNQVTYRDVDKTVTALYKYQFVDHKIRELFKNIKHCDAVVINGEGSMIFGNPTRMELFYFFAIMRIAKKMNKKCFYINAVASDNSFTGFNDKEFLDIKKNAVYCDYFVMRDKYSFDYLKKKQFSMKIAYCPDSLFSWASYIHNGLTVPNIGDSIIPFPDNMEDYGIFNFNKPYICISGSSYMTVVGKKIYKTVTPTYIKLVERLKKLDLQIFLIESCSNDAFLYNVSKETKNPVIPNKINLIQAIAILANARLLIGGRYHPAIMASLGGTPCIFTDSNSHKTFSLQQVLDYDSPKMYTAELNDNEIEEIYNDSKKILAQSDSIRQKITSKVDELAIETDSILKYIN